jgi:signal transduction histidine kinase
MFSRISGSFYRTAAWRLALRSTLVFAAGSAAIFVLMYFVVAAAVRERSDSWLIGESEVLKQVALATSRDALYQKIVEEVAELATEELAYDASGHRTQENTVFFMLSDPESAKPIWVGPQDNGRFQDTILRSNARERTPVSIRVDGWKAPFRVVAADLGADSGRIYLGLLDTSSTVLLRRLLIQFFTGWILMVGLGFLLALMGLRRMLKRVDAITTAAGGIVAGDLARRVDTGLQNDEIARLARTFNHMLDRIAASVNQLRTLTDAVAHDLKSPITTVRGSLEFALSTDDEETSRELIARAIENLDRLSDVITTSLDVAEADAGALRLHPEPVDLAELVERIAEFYAPAFAEKKQRMRIRASGPVRATVDERFFTRALSNLMENELNHAGEGALVEIVVERVGDRARICVEDDGPGFPPEMLDRVFQRFAKGSGSQGHGLGLSLVNAVAVTHGGQAKVRNLAHGGAEVVIEIPLSPAAEAPEERKTASDREPEAVRANGN